MFIAGRFVLGIGVAGVGISAPIYVAEISHPSFRSFQGGFYNTFWYIGSIVASWVCYGTAFLTSSYAFRIPLWLQLVSSVFVLAAVPFIPESPRHLINKGRIEDAKRVLTKYHGEGNENHPIVRLQMLEMQSAAALQQDDLGRPLWKEMIDYKDLWSTRAARRRLFVVGTFAFFGQYSGNAVVNYYFPVVMQLSGITDSHTQLLLNAINPVISYFATFAGALLLIRVGRRPMLLWSIAACVVIFAVMTGCGIDVVQTGSTTSSHVVIVFTYLFSVFFPAGWTPLQPFYLAECLDNHTRARGYAFTQFVSACASFIGQYAAAAAMGSIGAKYYAFFVAWDILEFLVIFYTYPETKDRTLEELTEVFEAPNPVKKSLEHRSNDTVAKTIRAAV